MRETEREWDRLRERMKENEEIKNRETMRIKENKENLKKKWETK